MARRTGGERLAYADLLRVCAAAAVVVSHLAGSRIGGVAVTGRDFQALNLYDGLTRWCVPVFVMLSGMFLLDPDRPLPLSKLLFRSALRVLVCLFAYGTLYAWLDRGAPRSWAGVKSALGDVLRAHTHYHLWFLYMILGLYLVTPILRAFCRGAEAREFRWFFLTAFLFASALPTLFQLWPNASAPLPAWIDRLEVRAVLGYVGYYVAGYFLKSRALSRPAQALIYALGCLGAVATVGGTALLSRRAGELVTVLYSNYAPNVVCFSVAVAVLFRYVLGVSDEGSRRQRLAGAAEISFGVYLVHDLFLMLLTRLGVSVLSFPPALSVPLLAAAVFLCSLAAAWLLSRLPLLGRWLT